MNAKPLQKILIALVLVTSLILSGCSALQPKAQADEINKVGDKIAGYSLPKGYSQQFAIDLLGYQMVSLTGATPSCHLFLVQAPKDTEVDIAKLQKQARTMEGDHKQNELRDVHVVETRTTTLRGKEVSLLVGEGINSDNQPYREVTALFEGRGGPALVNISSPVDQWDWDQVNQFLSSIE